jgi:hypothetical protein
MRKNEKGFTYPLTLCVLIVFLLFFSSRVELLLAERRIAQQTETILQEEYYFYSSAKKLEKCLQSGGTIQSKGTFKYGNGNMDYQAGTTSGGVQTINFTLRFNSGITVVGRGYFDTKLKKMVKWFELN